MYAKPCTGSWKLRLKMSTLKLLLFFLQPQVEVLSEEEGEEEEEEEDILSLAEEKYRPAALEKMIALIALLVEQSRSERQELLKNQSKF